MEKKIPTCIGIILDGNRRWALAHGLPKLEGHRRGFEKLKDAARWVRDRTRRRAPLDPRRRLLTRFNARGLAGCPAAGGANPGGAKPGAGLEGDAVGDGWPGTNPAGIAGTGAATPAP